MFPILCLFSVRYCGSAFFLFPCSKFQLYNNLLSITFFSPAFLLPIFFFNMSLLSSFFLSHCLYMVFSFFIMVLGLQGGQKINMLKQFNLFFLIWNQYWILNWADLYSQFILDMWKEGKIRRWIRKEGEKEGMWSFGTYILLETRDVLTLGKCQL